eukprot:TRINITY_DN11404_c0_g1_i3.p1 TRINITY_DN11404_c0_g1~~TRINITY_DN11404_c0_g1_i3.p1  ORF type:complete len:632 (+),score=142.13 TRINITY_DN11404_c0_g1_i3:86-1981(+)
MAHSHASKQEAEKLCALFGKKISIFLCNHHQAATNHIGRRDADALELCDVLLNIYTHHINSHHHWKLFSRRHQDDHEVKLGEIEKTLWQVISLTTKQEVLDELLETPLKTPAARCLAWIRLELVSMADHMEMLATPPVQDKLKHHYQDGAILRDLEHLAVLQGYCLQLKEYTFNLTFHDLLTHNSGDMLANSIQAAAAPTTPTLDPAAIVASTVDTSNLVVITAGSPKLKRKKKKPRDRANSRNRSASLLSGDELGNSKPSSRASASGSHSGRRTPSSTSQDTEAEARSTSASPTAPAVVVDPPSTTLSTPSNAKPAHKLSQSSAVSSNVDLLQTPQPSIEGSVVYGVSPLSHGTSPAPTVGAADWMIAQATPSFATATVAVQTTVTLTDVPDATIAQALDNIHDPAPAPATTAPLKATPTYEVRFAAGDPFSRDMSAYFYEIGRHVGLSEQDYTCWRCEKKIMMKDKSAMFCWYTGKYYCPACHGGKKGVVPALAMHNWDLEPKPMCKAAIEHVDSVAQQPSILLNYHIPWLMDVEPAFKQIDELRRDLTHAYLTAKPCADFEPIKHLGRLPGLWVLEDDNLYAWADLLVIHAGKYTPKVGVALESINEHIANCETCGLQALHNSVSTDA